ncbi:MAG: hypothetical protein FAZ92_01349 [Accumulibacter sp.]|nr:MAG: hypothetical protein FAZ92_01349 [Accumulibacter sp.]
MKDQAGILQQRVEVAPFLGPRQQALEGVRSEQDEEQEAGADQPEDAEDPCHHVIGQLPRQQCHCQRPHDEHQDPQQQRSLVPAPDGGDPIRQRQQGIRVLCDVEHREIVLHEGGGQAGEGDRQQQRLDDRRRAGEGNPLPLPGVGAEQRQHALGHGDAERENEGKGADFRDHGRLAGVTV